MKRQTGHSSVFCSLELWFQPHLHLQCLSLLSSEDEWNNFRVSVCACVWMRETQISLLISLYFSFQTSSDLQNFQLWRQPCIVTIPPVHGCEGYAWWKQEWPLFSLPYDSETFYHIYLFVSACRLACFLRMTNVSSNASIKSHSPGHLPPLSDVLSFTPTNFIKLCEQVMRDVLFVIIFCSKNKLYPLWRGVWGGGGREKARPSNKSKEIIKKLRR